MSGASKPQKSWEIALNDLKTYGATGHAGEVAHLRSVEIAGGLVRDYVHGLEEQHQSLEDDFDRMKAAHDRLSDQVDELEDSESRLHEQLEAAREALREIADGPGLEFFNAPEVARRALECVCGEINTRHCPVHGQDSIPARDPFAGLPYDEQPFAGQPYEEQATSNQDSEPKEV